MILALIAFVTAINPLSFKSQFKQDEFVYQAFFKDKRDGVFVDIGAHDGIGYSNTYFFEKTLGWKGLCIEPIPEVFAQLRNNRKAICVQGCINNRKGDVSFMRARGAIEMLSGIVDKYDPRHLQRLKREAANAGITPEIITVPSLLLNELLEEHHFFHVDYLSIDTEGGELDILKSIDYDRFDISVIDVENNYQSSEIRDFLASKNYRFVTKLDVDEIYSKIR